MNTPRMVYFEEADVLHLIFSEENESGSVEISPHITAELFPEGYDLHAGAPV